MLTRVMIHNAIVRPPGTNFATGLTTVTIGTPSYDQAIVQHDAYCECLERCGIRLTRLVADERYPDSTFVEDTAVVTDRCAIVTRPGAPSRAGEIAAIANALKQFYSKLHVIRGPGTVDGGDVCEAGNHFLIGVSHRTNDAGARQLAKLLAAFDYTSSLVDIRGLTTILHLKSGVAYLGDNRLAVIDALRDREELRKFELVRVPSGETYAANCVRVNDHVLVAAGFSQFEEQLRGLGYQTTALGMSEFQKMDGGLSCLSLRF